MTVGILGSGFGLYGYLPALVRMGEHVVMPERYRGKLRGRADVASLESSVDWLADEEAVMAQSLALVVSRRPTDQVRDVRAALERSAIQRFLLEKPLGPDPASALALFDALDQAGRAMRLGFIFTYAPWVGSLRGWIAEADEDAQLVIDWRFRAHHYATGLDTWKRRTSAGGGALRFYGIHLVALMAELGYAGVSSSRVWSRQDDETEAWEASFTGRGRPTCRIRVDSNADDTAFEVAGAGGKAKLSAMLRDPFDQLPAHDAYDRRTDALTRLCRSLLGGVATSPPSWYRASLALWAMSERMAYGSMLAHAPLD